MAPRELRQQPAVAARIEHVGRQRGKVADQVGAAGGGGAARQIQRRRGVQFERAQPAARRRLAAVIRRRMVPGEHRGHQRLVPAGAFGELGCHHDRDALGTQLAEFAQHAAGELEALEGRARRAGVAQHRARLARIGEHAAACLPGARGRAALQRLPAWRLGEASEQVTAGQWRNHQQRVQPGDGARAGQARHAADHGCGGGCSGMRQGHRIGWRGEISGRGRNCLTLQNKIRIIPRAS